jgi:hypothetical protein
MSNSNAIAGRLPSKEVQHKERLPLQLMLLDQQLLVGSMPHPWSIAASGDVETSNKNLVEILDELRLEVQQRGVNLTGYKHDFLERLKETGAAAYNKFLPEAAQKQIGDFEAQQAQAQGVSLNFLEMTASPRSFLWELLYAGDPLEDVDPTQFWGFRYRLGRTYMGLDWNLILRLGAGVLSAIHDELEFSRDEVERLREQFTQLCQQWQLEKATWQYLEHCLQAEAVSINHFIKLLISDQFQYGFVHLACHCENPEDIGVDKAYLSLTVHGQPVELSLEKLIGLKGKYHFMHRPFFFLNACESATPGHIMHKLNFPTGILSLKASGVIATACIMPDNFASAFATEFYHRLWSKPSRTDSIYIGEALLETRLHFLNENNNPLGLAYGLYAISDQQLQFE